MKYYVIVLLLFVAIYCNLCNGKQLPSFIQKCKLADPVARNKCILERVEDLKPRLIEGIPELKIPKIEPFHFPKIQVRTGNENTVGFTATLLNIDFYGVKNFQVKALNLDLENGSVFLDVYIPYLNAVGQYNFKGKVLLFELDSTGTGQVNITEIHAKTNRKLSKVQKNGKEYVQLEDGHDLDVKYDKVSVYFENLIKNNPQLTEQTNKAVNDNYAEIGREIDPLVSEAIQSVIFGIIKNVVETYSLDELFD